MVIQVWESKNVAMSLSFSIIIGDVILSPKKRLFEWLNAGYIFPGEDESRMVSLKLMRTVQHFHDVGRYFCLE